MVGREFYSSQTANMEKVLMLNCSMVPYSS
jgi:hypothetical protein